MRRSWIIAGLLILLILLLLSGLYLRDSSSRATTKKPIGESAGVSSFPEAAEGAPAEIGDAVGSGDPAADPTADPSLLEELADVTAIPTLEAHPETSLPFDPWTDPPLSGTRFEVTFEGYRPPHISGAAFWRIVSFRDLLVGCSAVRSAPLGGPIARLVYRTLPGASADDGSSRRRGGAASEIDPDALVSVVVFLVAAPFDRNGQLIPGFVEAYGGEVHTTVGALLDNPQVSLARHSSATEFTIAFATAGSAASIGEAEYSGSFGHAGAVGRWQAEELVREFDTIFPTELEPFLNEQEHVRFTDVPFTFTSNSARDIRFFNWPDGMTLPLRIRRVGDPAEALDFREPESLLVRFGGVDQRVIPRHLDRLEYAPGPQSGMPPIEVVGVEFANAVVSVEEQPWLSALANYSARLETWLWQVHTPGSIREGFPFTAWLLGPGIEPTRAKGRYGSSRPLRFRARSARREERLEGEIIVDPARRMHVPLVGELTLTWKELPITQEIRLIARSGRYALEISRELTPASLELAIDTVAWAEQLRAMYRARRGVELEPIWIEAELLAIVGDRRWYEVTVHSDLESWSIGDFFDRFDL